MSVTKIGLTRAHITNVERIFDPNAGEQTVETWEGEEDALITEARSRILPQGGKARIRQLDGPVYQMTVIWGDAAQSSVTETPTERWERVTEYVQEDLRNNPNVIASAGTSETLNRWVVDIKEALRKKQTLDVFYGTPGDFSGIASEQVHIYNLYSRGADSHEFKRFVLRVRRVISINYAAPFIPRSTEVIYTTASLVNTFKIPANVAATLPSTPSAPAGTAWAWKQRQENSIFLAGLNKIEETRDWVFAAWSTLLYTLV